MRFSFNVASRVPRVPSALARVASSEVPHPRTSVCTTFTHTVDSMSTYSDGIPTSFDPALLNSELEFLEAPATTSFSDDLAAIQQCIADSKVEKTRAGIVIQHRIWNKLDAFRSEEDYPIGIADSRSARYLG